MPLNSQRFSMNGANLFFTTYKITTSGQQRRIFVASYNHQRQKSFQNLSINQSSRASATVASAPNNATLEKSNKCYNNLDLTFQNGQEAFKSKTNTDLIRALAILKLCSIKFLVQNNVAILNSLPKIFGDRLFQKILKSTFYNQFVAGETLDEIEPKVQTIRNFGVKSILDYSVESDISQEEAENNAVEGKIGEDKIPTAINNIVDDKVIEETQSRYGVHKEFGDRRVDVVSARTYFYAGEHECDKNVEIFCKSIDAVGEATRREGFSAIKLTALGRPQLLLKLSEIIAQTHNFFRVMTGSTWEKMVLSKLSEDDFLKKLKEFGIMTDTKQVQEWFKTVDFDDDGFVDFYEWGQLFNKNKELAKMFQLLNIRTGRVEPLIQNLSKGEEQEFSNMMQRLVHIAEYSVQKGVRIMIDAEQTYFQPAISRLSVALMRKYNQNNGQILNTYQAYLKNALTNIEIDMHLANREGFHFGCKLVRGAYMDQERKRAQAIGYEDPINANYETTNQMYLNCLKRIVQEHTNRGPGHVSVMVASHNIQTVRDAVQLMKDTNIAPSERTICFAQLYGMCDQVTFSLGQAGYSVYKYVPYGPVKDVIPYLSRRALENGGMLKKLDEERNLMWTELKRRLFSGQFVYNVPIPR